MKKVFMLLIVTIFGICLVGCNSDENNIVKIDKEEDDVKNIVSILNESRGTEATFIMDNKMRGVQEGTSSFYLCEINDEEYSVLCAYIDESQYEYERFRTYEYYSKVEWYKYTKNDVISENINELKLTGIFVVYDAIIKQDVINGKLYNLNCKYYSKIEEKNEESYRITDDFNFKLNYNNLIIWESKEMMSNSNYFITDRVFDLGYEVRTNLEDEKRVVFNKVTTVSKDEVQNWINNQFGESYQYFCKYFKNEEDFEKIVHSPTYYELYEKVSIDLEHFIKIEKEIDMKG